MRLRINYFISFSLFKIINDNDDDRRLYKFKIEFVISFNYVIEITL